MPTVSRLSEPTDSPPSDRQLIAAHLAGDQQAFTELVRRHRDRLWGVALRTLGDREEASDALQDALISAFRNAGSYRGDAAVTTWLHRVVVNACLDRLRRRKARPADALGERDVAAPIDEHRRTEARIDVHSALARLPEAQRAALVLVDLQDFSVAEAAEMLGVAEGTVKSRCSRGRTALALLLRPPAPPTLSAEPALTAEPTLTAGTARSSRASHSRRAAPSGPIDIPGIPGISGGNRVDGLDVGPSGAQPTQNVAERSQPDEQPPAPPTSNVSSEGW